eukprot:scaffold118_cov111-Skeletonema_marinoi.AAC.1
MQTPLQRSPNYDRGLLEGARLFIGMSLLEQGAISRSARWREAFSFSCRIGRREMRVAEIEIWNFTAMLYLCYGIMLHHATIVSYSCIQLIVHYC